MDQREPRQKTSIRERFEGYSADDDALDTMNRNVNRRTGAGHCNSIQGQESDRLSLVA